MNTTTAIPSHEVRSPTYEAYRDLTDGLGKVEVWGRMGWLDVKRRYRRTTLGPFWNSATLTIYTLAVGSVGGGLFHQNVHDYLPYLFSGMIVWMFVSTIVLESCALFVVGGQLIRNVRLEFSLLAYSLVWRNLISFAHNLLMFVVVMAVLKPQLFGLSYLLIPPGVVIVIFNGVWIALLLGMICLRFRDVPPLIQTVVQILMLVTPIFWTATSLSGVHQLVFVQLNPVYHLINIVRSPLLGLVPTLTNYIAALAITVIGWLLTFAMFRVFRKRIPYWA